MLDVWGARSRVRAGERKNRSSASRIIQNGGHEKRSLGFLAKENIQPLQVGYYMVHEDVVDVVDLLYLEFLVKHEFFRHFIVKKTSFFLPAERLSCLYIQWYGLFINMQYVQSVCG